MTFVVPLEDGAKIHLRRHGNPEGARILLSHGNGFAIDAYFPYWQHLLANFDLLVFDFAITGRMCQSCRRTITTSSSRAISNASYR